MKVAERSNGIFWIFMGRDVREKARGKSIGAAGEEDGEPWQFPVTGLLKKLTSPCIRAHNEKSHRTY